MAVIEGLKAIKKAEWPVTIYSDSQYVVNAISKGWLTNWMKTNFKGDKKNPDLWRSFHQISQNFQITMVWVKGHADNAYNNRCDELATAAADSRNLLVDEGYEKMRKS